MITKPDKNAERKWRSRRSADIHGTKERPRLCVYRSLNNIYAQIIDDDKGETLFAFNTQQKEMASLIKGKTKKEQAFIIGEQIGKAAKAKKIASVVFDRNGYVYHGRVAQVADGARSAGLKF